MKNKLLEVFIRYFILIIIAIPNLYIFYFIFTPLTIYLVFFILNLFFNVSLLNTLIIFSSDYALNLIPSCIAGSAYYLLLILNLSVPDIKIKKRIKMLLFSFSLLLLANIIRIVILAILSVNNSYFFDITHKIFWIFLSTLFVVGIWFLEVRVFKIKSIPFYSDITYLYKISTLNKKRKWN